MQYRDRIASVIDLEAVFEGIPRSLTELEEVVPIVVVTLDEHHTVALIVHQILDIVEDSLTITGASSRPGIQCYATVQEHVTEILDIHAIIDLANPYRPRRESMTGIRG